MEMGTLVGTLYLAAGSFLCLLGLVIFRENPSQQLNRVSALMLFLGGIGAVLGATDFLVRSLRPEGTQVFGALIRNFAYLWELFFPALLLFAATFPSPRRWLTRRKYVPVLLFLPHAFHFVLLLVASVAGPELGLPRLGKAIPLLGAPLQIAGVALKLLLQAHRTLFTLVDLAYAVAAVVLLIRSARATRVPRLRGQIRVIGLGLGATLALYIAAIPLPLLAGFRVSKATESTLVVAGLLVGSASIAYAIVRHRFLDTRLIARRTILYGTVSVAVVVIYLALVKPIGAFARNFTGSDTALFETLFVVVTLLAFQPLVARLEEGVDRYLLGDRRDHRRVLEEISRDVVTILDQKELAARLLAALGEGLLVSRATLLAREGGDGVLRALAHSGPPAAAGEEEALGVLVARLPQPAERRGGALRPEDLLEAFGESEEEDWARAAGALLGVELLVPLRHRGETLGLLLLGPKLTATRYTAAETVLLETLGNQSAVALKNAALYQESLLRAAMEEELAVARQIQQASLPAGLPAIGPCEVAGRNIPSRQVGGDYYDVRNLPDGRLLVAIGDVSGKGVPAALLMSMIQASLRTLASERRAVREMAERLNRLVCETVTSDRFVSLFLGVMDPAALTLTFTNAGHDPPLLLRPGEELRRCCRGGLLLGVLENAVYEEETLSLRAGDRLVCYTDGVTEARNAADQEFGPGGLAAALGQGSADESAGATVERMVSRVRDFAGGGEPADDLTLLVLRVTGGCG